MSQAGGAVTIGKMVKRLDGEKVEQLQIRRQSWHRFQRLQQGTRGSTTATDKDVVTAADVGDRQGWRCHLVGKGVKWAGFFGASFAEHAGAFNGCREYP